MSQPVTKVKTDENGNVLLAAGLEPNTVYNVEHQGKAIRLEPEPATQPFWATATPEEWVEAFNKWIDKSAGPYGLSLEAISRDSIYD